MVLEALLEELVAILSVQRTIDFFPRLQHI
jgi:hypothetical protein